MGTLRLCLLAAFLLLGENLFCCADNSSEMNQMNEKSIEILEYPIETDFDGALNETDQFENVINSMILRSEKNEFETKKMSILKAISKVDHSKSIDELIDRIQHFPMEILNDKSISTLNAKLNKQFTAVAENGKRALEMAQKFEKLGRNTTRNEQAKLNKLMKKLRQKIKKFAERFKLESQKQRNKCLKILHDRPENVNQLRLAKRAMNIIDLLHNMISLLEGIPAKINCLITGQCHDNNGGDGNNDADSIDSGNGDSGEGNDEEYDNGD